MLCLCEFGFSGHLHLASSSFLLLLFAVFIPEIDALQPPFSALVLDVNSPFNSKDTPGLYQAFLRFCAALHRRNGHHKHFRASIEVKAVDAAAQGGRIQYAIISVACLCSYWRFFVDTDCCEKLSRRKIATSRNTLRHAMLVEVRLSLLHFHFNSRSRAASGPHHSHLSLQSSFRGSRGLRVRPSCRRPRQLYRQMEDISTKPRNSWMTIGLS